MTGMREWRVALLLIPSLMASGATPTMGQVAPTAVPGLGSLAFPVTSASAQARGDFQRGVLLLHLFHYREAITSFRKAEAADPGFTMAYWGEALAWTYPVWNIQYADSARAVLKKLASTTDQRLVMARSPRERDYLAAVEVLYGDGPKAHRDTLYASVMEQLSAAWPEDDEAKLFTALALMGLSQGVRNVPTYLRAADLAEAVFRRQPNHPGAEHYLIHAVDDPEHASRGLKAARALSATAPDADHAQHMTSHIFMAMGLWEDVVRANEQAMRVVNANRSARGQSPAFCGHYNSWLDYGYLQVDRVEDARTLLHNCQAQSQPSPGRSTATDPDEFSLFSAVAMWSRFLIDTEEWSGPEADWSPDLGPSPGPRLTWHFTHGLAAARRGDVATAEADLQAFRQAARQARPAEGSPKAGDPEILEYQKRLIVLELELEGMLAAARGQDNASLTLLQQATVVEDSMAYAFGPPVVDKPSHELLGEELLRQGLPARAAGEFSWALKTTPNRALARRGLARAAERAESSGS